ncbi:30S ribosome-binding factor RbfA [Psittacicella hinzii]|uniref:Ribosome-binding factor A n=1 Tax=Psittacicella hinzii TaxID=2028575 RepID=A0A3A1Y9R4_9GAMM|nr:30S ribosome-binding factor RbfA [Psittacicella hinzii]RIY35053.1 ribosome-binding factor A [Psittacicella hinzii]
MQKNFKRSDRVASEIQKQLSIILQREINANEYGLISVNKIEISPDLMYVKAFVSFLDLGNSNLLSTEEKLKHLSKQTPYIRSLLSKSVKLRVVPEIRFIHDDSADKLDHMNRLIKSINKTA